MAVAAAFRNRRELFLTFIYLVFQVASGGILGDDTAVCCWAAYSGL
jgi:hypothetical protein